MLKAVIIDSSGVARGSLATVLASGSYEVCGQAANGPQGRGMLIKHRPHLVCIAREHIEEGSLLQEIRTEYPKTLIFMVSGGIDAASLKAAVEKGVHGFIVKPFKADTVLKTIRNTVLQTVRRQQKALDAATGAADASPEQAAAKAAPAPAKVEPVPAAAVKPAGPVIKPPPWQVAQ